MGNTPSPGQDLSAKCKLVISTLQNTEIAWLEAHAHVRQCEMQTSSFRDFTCVWDLAQEMPNQNRNLCLRFDSGSHLT